MSEDKKELDKLLEEHGKNYEQWAMMAAAIVFFIVVATVVYSLLS